MSLERRADKHAIKTLSKLEVADYAKTLVMSHAKFLGRVLSYQMDFNESITDFYKKILRHTTDIPDEIIEDFEFAFTPPKTLNNMNREESLCWARYVKQQFDENHLENQKAIFLCGENYYKYLLDYFKEYELPLKGLSGMGYQIQYMKSKMKRRLF